MLTVFKGQLEQAVEQMLEKVASGIKLGWFEAETTGRVPTVLVMKISARKYDVFWNYQPKELKAIDTVEILTTTGYQTATVFK